MHPRTTAATATIAALLVGIPHSPAVASSPPGDDDVAAFSVTAALAELPALSITDTGYMITVGDVDAAVAAAGVERTDAIDMDSLLPWLGPVTGLPIGDDDPPRFAPVPLLFPEPLSPNYAAQIEEIAPVVGWSVADVSWYSAYSSPPNDVTVLHGAFGDAALAGLPVVEGDIVTLGEGDDFAMNPAGRNALSPIGAPVRMARADDAIVVSRSTPAAAAWLAGAAPTAADNSALAAIAAALDEAGVSSAIIGTTFLADPLLVLGPDADPDLPSEITDKLLPAAATNVGIGWGVDDGGAAVVTVVYFVVGGDDALTATATAAEAAFTEGVSLRTGGPLTELVTFDSVASAGSVVTVTLRPADGRSPLVVSNMWMSSDLGFVVG